MDTQTKLQEIFNRYLDGGCSPEEIRFLFEHFGTDNRMFLDELVLKEFEQLDNATALPALPEYLYEGIESLIHLAEPDVTSTPPVKKQGLYTLFSSRTKIAAAAAIILIASIGIWFYTSRHPDAGKDLAATNYANDIAPGKNTATLTLANGKTINLSDSKAGIIIDAAKLTYNDGTDLGSRHPEFSSASLNGKATMLSATTPLGGQYQITLPDGTHVWLNAASKISFPSQFSGKNRKILLKGEAYFEVSKNKNKPFIVETDKQEITVLGTQFNVNAYTDEPVVKTTLIEGSVRIGLSGQQSAQHSKVLMPGCEAINTGTNIEMYKVDTDLAVAWKNNQFIFESDDIRYIMRMIARWYNVEVEYQGEIPSNKFGGAVSRFEHVSEVLRPLQATGKVKFKIEGRKIIVSK